MIGWLSTFALAASVPEGLRAQIHPGAFTFVAESLAAEPLGFGPLDVDAQLDCYDLSVQNFNLSIEVESLVVDPTDGSLAVDLHLGRVRGENIGVEGVSGYFDLCIDFDASVEYVELLDGHITGELVAERAGDHVELSFATPPTLTGEIDSDIDWFPDDLAWALFGDLVFAQVEQVLATEISTLLEEPINCVVASSFGEVSTALQVSALDASPDGVYAAVDVAFPDVDGPDAPPPSPLDVSPRGGSHFAVAVSDALVQGLVDAARVGGVLSSGTAATESLLADLQQTLGLDDIVPSLEVDGAPTVNIDPDGITVTLPGVHLEAEVDGERVLYLLADLSAQVEPDVDSASSMIVLSARAVAIDVREIDVSRLMDTPDGAEHLEAFLEGWTADAAASMFDRIPLFKSHFPVFGDVIFLNELELQQGGISAWFSLFHGDDPRVDLVPPEATVTVRVDGALATASFGAEDDRAPPDGVPFEFRHRLDGGAWSGWSREPTAQLDVGAGPHEIEVSARDAWQNEDPTPNRSEFTVEAPAPEPGGCGCGGGRPAGIGAVVLAFAWVRRRPRGS